MSYDAYREWLKTMTADQLRQEVLRLQRAWLTAKTNTSKAAWGRMLGLAQQQERRNGA